MDGSVPRATQRAGAGCARTRRMSSRWKLGSEHRAHLNEKLGDFALDQVGED